MIREEIIKKYVTGKDVLDIGSVGQTESYNQWKMIKNAAKSLVGIDIEKSDDKDIVYGDMETYSFGRKFDVILLGDVLEHVSNQGLLLDNINRHLAEGGVLIITTPNSKWFTIFLPNNPTHVLWHDRSTLGVILARHGFYIDKFRYYYGNKPHYNLFIRPLVARQQMLAICRLKKRNV